MFDYTKEIIVNDVNNIKFMKSGSEVLPSSIASPGDADAIVIRKPWIALPSAAKGAKVVSFSRRKAQAGFNEKLVLSVPGAYPATIAADDVIRLTISLAAVDKIVPTFNDNYPVHQKHFHYEVKSTGVIATDLAALAAQIKKIEPKFTDLEFFTINAAGDTIETVDQFTQIVEVRLEKIHAPFTQVGQVLTGYEDVTPILKWNRAEATAKATTRTPGDASTQATVTYNGHVLSLRREAAGDVASILKNKRILTPENNDFFGIGIGNPNNDDRPLAGHTYDQFMIELETETRMHGGQVVGSVNRSITSFIIFADSATVAPVLDKVAFPGVTLEDLN